MERRLSSLFDEPADATPLAPDEREGLRQSWITHRGDLNIAEERNIVAGAAWARRHLARWPAHLLTVAFANDLHRHMLGEVWRWAGRYRTTARNIGIEAARIPAEMPMVFDDVRYWLDARTYPVDEIAVRLHYRLVAVHPFPNGNGRHARLMADLLMARQGQVPLTWGSGNLRDTGSLREAYVTALRAADRHDLAPLIDFARS